MRSVPSIIRSILILLLAAPTIAAAAPQAVWGKQFAYVVQQDLETLHDYIVRVNVATGLVEQRIDGIENALTYVAANTPKQRMYFVEESLDRLVELDIRSGVIQRYFVAGDPHGVAVSPDGERVYVAQFANDALAIFDADNLAAGPVHTVPVGDRPVGITTRPDGNVVYVSNPGDHTVSAVDVRLEPPVVASVSLANASHTAPNPLGIAASVDGNAVFVALAHAHAIAVLDTSALQSVYVADVAAFTAPVGVAAHPSVARAYVASRGNHLVQYLDYSVWPILTPLAPAIVGTEPYGIAVDRTGSRVLTLSNGTPAQPNDGRLSVFEAATGQLQWHLRLGFNRSMLGNFVIEEIDLPLLVDGFE